MNIALWIIAGLLAVASLASGAAKLTQPKDKLAASGYGWVEDFNSGTVKAIGTLEVLAAVGLILPAALGIAPVLVPLAAVGLVMLMVGAISTHLRRREPRAIVAPLAVLALAVLVAWGQVAACCAVGAVCGYTGGLAVQHAPVRDSTQPFFTDHRSCGRRRDAPWRRGQRGRMRPFPGTVGPCRRVRADG